MTITGSGRLALIVAAGLWLGIAGPIGATETSAAPADAAATGTPDKPIALNKFNKPRTARKSATKSRKADKAAAKAAAQVAADADAKDVKDAVEPMPDAVANANAQLPAHAPTETPQSVSAKADSVLKGISNGPDATVAPVVDAGAQVVAEDQLNELDRAASTEKADDKPALTLASATIDAPPVVSPTNSTTLDQTSLIGKIFIAFGGLLTLASAARMFIA